MSQWPTNPTWIDPSTINNGNQFEPLDGLTYVDLNIIINDLLYLSSLSN